MQRETYLDLIANLLAEGELDDALALQKQWLTLHPHDRNALEIGELLAMKRHMAREPVA